MPRNHEPGMPGKKKTSGGGKWEKYKGGAGNGDASWAKVDTAAIIEAIVAVTETGGAILLGKTRNGGALVVTVCEGEERVKFYSATREETQEHLGQISDTAQET